ncbi:MAG: YfhO family protein, partial [Oscillospiraceae bacterium]|nr:YfhO family protein [Oscillospiraceae bacterium]
MASQTSTQKSMQKSKDSADNWGRALKKLSDKMGQFYLWEILAFLLPFIFLGIGFAKKEIHPFGDQQFLVTDLWHQYYPFFQILQDKLTSGGSLLYTWRSGLGTNFLAMMSYYAASPLNLLSFLIPKAYLREGLTVILMLKFSFAGFFMAGMLRYVFKRNDITITMFGVMYALCSYMLGYYWNIIWIDTVALLPLVMQGLVALVRDGKYRLYVIALAVSMISSYYIGYMVCVFVVISFFLICLYESVGFRKFGKRFLLVTGTSVLGGGLAAWILLPAFFALQLTHSANNSFPKTITFYEAWRDILGNMLSFTEPTAKEGLPNLYCGLLPVLLLGVFVVAKKIRLREKISGILLLAFLLVSCNMNVLNYIWHAFHFPNMLPYRFAFIFSFVMLVAGYRAFTVLLEEKLSIIQWISMLVVGGVFCFLGYGSKIQEDDDHKFVMASAILGGVYLIIIFFRLFAPKQLVQVMVALALIFEMGNAAITGVKTVGSSSYSSYPSYNKEIQEMLSQSKKLDNELFYRTELTGWYTLNDPFLYYYDGVSQFSSMANEHVTTYLRKI